MTVRGIILAIAALALTPAATAQKIPSAESGVAPLAFAGFAPSAATVTVKPGDTAWTEQVYPANAVRLLDPAKPRGRPGADGLPAGALLFGYQLSTGMAFCPPLNPAKSFKRVQCFRDLDNDGTFDGGYVTGDDDADSRYFSTFLHAITGVPKYRYESVSGDLLPGAATRVILADMKNGAPRFRLQIDNETLESLLVCYLPQSGVCYVLGVQFAFAAADNGAVTLTFHGSTPVRTIDIRNTSDPLKP